MGGLAQLVLRPAPVETQHRDSPFVLDLRIDLAIGLIIGDHLTAPGERDEGSVIAAHVLLELHPVAAAGQPLDPGGSYGVKLDRKSTRLNSSHANISYAVFCLKKK